MSTLYPYDYHPLAPLLRQLRSTIKWLDQSGVHLQNEQVQSLLQRVSELSNKQPKDQRTLKISRYWSSLPYGTAYLNDQTAIDEHDSHVFINDQPLPASSFPAVIHQRAVIESISFDNPPPSDKDMEGSALLMEPSEALLQHKGVGEVTKEEPNSIPVF